MKKYNYILTIIFLFYSLFLCAQEPITNTNVEDIDGNKYVLSEVLKNKRYVVNLYADWCGWCKKEWKELDECIDDIKNNYDLDFLVLASNQHVPFNDSKEDLQESIGNYVDIEKLSLYYINQDTLIDNFDVPVFPTSYLIDEDGNILNTVPGYQNCETLEEKLEISFGTTSTNQPLKFSIDPIINYNDHFLNISVQMDQEYNVHLHTLSGQKIKSYNNLYDSCSLEIPDLEEQLIVVSFQIGSKIVKSIQVAIIN